MSRKQLKIIVFKLELIVNKIIKIKDLKAIYVRVTVLNFA